MYLEAFIIQQIRLLTITYFTFRTAKVENILNLAKVID